MTITSLIQANPRISIIILSFIVTLLITLVTYFMTDKARMKEIREKQKMLRLEIKKYKNNPEKVMQLNKQMLEDMPEQFRHSLRPMLVTIIPLLVLFGWLRSIFSGTIIASTWIWWYIIASIIFSILVRKIFGLQ